jgi:hypothetical protein
MFLSDELIYIQMPKTACTFIGARLSEVFDGEFIGRHNAATPEQIDSGRTVVTSIRDPWEWYLSVWTFGVLGEGAVRSRLTRRNVSRALKLALKHPGRNVTTPLRELHRDIDWWKDVYGSAEDVQRFRAWLKAVHSPENAYVLGREYGNMVLPALCGFLTYRYLFLCCRDTRPLYDAKSIVTHADLKKYDAAQCYIDDFIRVEQIDSDLCAVIERFKPLNDEVRSRIVSGERVNASQRAHALTDYYDRECLELVGQRDRLIVEKFGYSPPSDPL